MLNNLINHDTDNYTGFFFVGRVVYNEDPTKLERVKCEIPGLYEGQLDDLPWIAPATGRRFSNKTGQGEFGVPSIGTYLYVVLQQGNAHYPMYIGSPVQQRSDLPEADVNYPHRYGFKDPAGNVFYIDTMPGVNEVKFTHASGMSITVDKDGNITTNAPSWTHNGDITVNGDVIASGVSLVTHRHGGVDTGGGQTSAPVT